MHQTSFELLNFETVERISPHVLSPIRRLWQSRPVNGPIEIRSAGCSASLRDLRGSPLFKDLLDTIVSADLPEDFDISVFQDGAHASDLDYPSLEEDRRADQ